MSEGNPLTSISVFQFLLPYYDQLSTQLEQYLEREGSKFHESIEDDPTRNAKDDIKSWALNVLYPSTFRCSFFVTLYSQFDYYIDKVCKELKQLFNYNLTLAELKEKGIQRSYVYLKKIVQIDDPFLEKSWDRLNDLNTLRNLIVHGDAMLSSEDTRSRTLISKVGKWAPLEVKEDQIILSNGFNHQVISLLSQSTEHLGKKIHHFIQTRPR